jgi:hypothetical protein
MWDVFKCIKSSPEVPHAIILVYVIIYAPTVYKYLLKRETEALWSDLCSSQLFLDPDRRRLRGPQAAGGRLQLRLAGRLCLPLLQLQALLSTQQEVT